MLRIQRLHQVQLPALIRRRQPLIRQPRDHLSRLQVGVIDVHALVLRRQEGTAPQDREAHRLPRAQHHERRQVRILIAQSVAQPGAHARHALRHRAIVHQQQGGAVIRIVRVAGAQHAKIICMPRQIRQQLADLQPALPVLCIRIWRCQQAARRPLRAQVRTLRLLARILCQSRLRIEKIRPERPAVHEQMDHPLCLRQEVRLRPRLHRRRQPQRPQPASHAGQQFTTGERGEIRHAGNTAQLASCLPKTARTAALPSRLVARCPHRRDHHQKS